MRLKFNRHEIISLLNRAGIKYKNTSNIWVPIKCPMDTHKSTDISFDSSAINVETGVIHCFSCDRSVHINSFLGGYDIVDMMLDTGIIEDKKVEVSKPVKRFSYINSDSLFNFTTIPLDDPDKYYYTRQRGFTKDFCEEFNIQVALSSMYNDFMVVPIIENGAVEFEARKLKEFEVLCKLYGDKNLKELRELHKEKQLGSTDELRYLSLPKTLYQSGSKIKNTLFNYGNLDEHLVLYLVEGVASLPRIWSDVSRNVTCLFGLSIYEAQIELLKKFDKIIFIPDPDTPGRNAILKYHDHLHNLYIKDIGVEDTALDYTYLIANMDEISSSEYISTNFIIKEILGG